MSYYGYRERAGRGSVHGSISGSGSRSGVGSDSDGQDTETGSSGTSSSSGPVLPFPGFTEVALKYLTQDTRPRNWCLKLITNPWFERISMLVILLNCVTLGMYQPCVDDQCVTNRCKILQMFDDIIFAFFSLEMTIKMVAMGVYGKSTYLADSWNRLDFFIVMAGALEYCLHVENMNLSAIRTIRVLRPLRAINRIPSMRILVMLLLDTLPMLGNVLLLCFFVFFIFGIVGVQLWEGILRQRCELVLPPNVHRPNVSFHYEFSKEQDYICTTAEDSGMHLCANFPPYRYGSLTCNGTPEAFSLNAPTATSCVNWNQYYTNCTQRGSNPFQGTISFDNIGLAWVAIFLVISLEGWTDIMYYVQDAHSFWDWIYFVLLIVIGSFFMINLCLVVIATQFSETKKREMERMRQERARFTSTSTLASSTNNSEPATCYAEIVKYIGHLWRRFNRRMAKKYRLYKYRREQRREARGLGGETLALGGRPRQHHPCCPRMKMLCQPENECPEEAPSPRPLLRAASVCVPDDNTSGLALLSPPSLGRRRSSVMFSDVVVLHGAECGGGGGPSGTGSPNLSPPPAGGPREGANVCSSEKMTQTGDGNIWQTNPNQPAANSDIGLVDAAMTCQELLALSGALSAALPTGQVALDSFFDSLTKGITKRNTSTLTGPNSIPCETQRMSPPNQMLLDEDFSCCGDMQQFEIGFVQRKEKKKRSRLMRIIIRTYRFFGAILGGTRRWVKRLVEHKYFQQGILLAILINTLSMGIEYHNQPEELTVIVEISNVVFSAIFAVEMLLKVIAEGPFGYIANGFNVFDGVIVVLSAFELTQTFMGEREQQGSSGLSVLRTFRLLRILKLVRFMPNLRRQLFVMLRTMDNVAIFFSLLVLFIFIFSILGMYLFGGKFCKFVDDSGNERECTCPEIVAAHPRCECDRKHFNNILWATVTVFQILTQEDWNIVLFNGMEKTSHWAALYFVALMTFGNYVLFNLLVAILVEGFSSERNERREREAREIAKSKLSAECFSDNNDLPYDESRSISESSESFTQHEIKNQWRSADDVRKVKDSNGHRERAQPPHEKHDKHDKHGGARRHRCRTSRRARPDDPKCNIQKESLMLQQGAQLPTITTTAATPQDSPNTTLEPGASFKEFNYNYSLSHSSLLDSLDSIDRSSSNSIPGLLKPPNSFTLTLHSASRAKNSHKSDKEKQQPPGEILRTPNGQERLPIPKPILSGSIEKLDHLNSNYSQTQYEKNIQLSKSSLAKDIRIPSHNSIITTSDKSSLLNEKKQLSNSEENQLMNASKCKIQRGCSWKLTRPSLRRKNSNTKHRSGSDSDAIIILNNGRDHSSSGVNFQHGLRKNDALLQSTNRIQNDTQGDTPNNKSTKGLSPQNSFKGMSPQNSIRSRASTYSAVPQVAWSGGLTNPPSQKSNISAKLHFPNQHHDNMSQRLARHRLSLTPDLLTGCHPATIENNNEKQNSEMKIQALQNQQQLNTMSPPKSSNIIISNLGQPDKTDNGSSNPLPNIKNLRDDLNSSANNNNGNMNITEFNSHRSSNSKLKDLFKFLEPKGCLKQRDEFALYLFSNNNRFRRLCIWIVERKWFDNVILLFIALNCITLAMERPNIPPTSTERAFLATANYVFTGVFALEMFVKVVASGMFYGPDAYFTSGWNIMDGSLVIISIIDLLMSLLSESSPRIFGILRVFRLLRSLRPLRVINRAPGLKLVVQTLLSSLRPIGNIVLICCTFFIIFGILGVQLFKGAFFYCEGENIKGIRNKTECLSVEGNVWINRKYNFDDLGKALMSLFVLSSRDGWVNIMYTGLDAVGVDQQPVVNYSEWRLLYFIAFILLVGFFVLNMFVGVVVENFHRCREEQEKEERVRRAAKRALQMEKKRRKMHEPPYYSNYSNGRLFVHNVVTSKYFDLAIAGVIGLNVVSMAIEYYRMPAALEYTLKIFNYFFTAVFILEAIMKLVALGFKIYLKDKWNQLDVMIVILSIVGIVLEELESNIIPINPTIMRVMRVLRIARVLKLLKMAKGIRALLDTVMQALPQVGNLGLLFFLLFFIFAALGVELFGRLECSEEVPCQGLGEHAHFANFGMAFLTLFRVATGDNWNGIMKDTLREECDSTVDCVKNCCVSTVIAPIFFVIFVLMAQFVLVNVVVAVLMKHLEESHKQMEDEMDMEVELEREMEKEQEDQEDQALCMALELESAASRPIRPLKKVHSLPADFVYSAPSGRNSIQLYGGSPLAPRAALRRLQYLSTRRQTLHAPRLSAVMAARSLDHSRGFLSREASTESYNPRRRLSREPSTESYQIRRLLTRESSTESYTARRHHLTRESSTDSYQNRRLRKRMDSITSDHDKSASATNVLYEEEPCFIDEDDETAGERTAVVLETKEDKEVLPKAQALNVRKDSEEGDLPLKRDGSLYKKKYKKSLTCEETCLLKPSQHSLEAEKQKQSTPSSFLNVPKNTRPAHKMYGSTKHLFKQAAVDNDGLEESSLLLPPSCDIKIEKSLPFLRVEIPTEYKPSSSKQQFPSVSSSDANKPKSSSVQIEILSQSPTEKHPAHSILNLNEMSTSKQMSPPNIVTESDFIVPQLTEEESIRKVIAERRKIDLMKPDYSSFIPAPSASHGTTQVLIESCQSPTNGQSNLAATQPRLKNDRHLSADRMSATNFSTSGESGEFLLGQRSSESYEETSDEQGLTINSASTAVVDKTNSINDADDLDCLIVVSSEDKDGNEIENVARDC